MAFSRFSLIKMLDQLPVWSWLIIGALSALGFAPESLWPLTLIGFALLICMLKSERNSGHFLRAWLFGVGHFTVALRWIAVAFTYQAAMPVWLGYLAVIGISLYLALFPAAAFLAARSLSNRSSMAASIFAYAGCWIITEYLRSQFFTGFAWNPLSVILVDSAGLTRQIGTYGLSGVFLLIAGGVALILSDRWKTGTAMIIAFVAALIIGHMQTVPAAINSKSVFKRTPISIIQPNISQADKYKPGYEIENYSKLAQLMPKSAALSVDRKAIRPRLIFWPEAAINWYLESGYPRVWYSGQPAQSAVATRITIASLLHSDDLLITGADRLILDKQGNVIGARNSVVVLDSKANLLPEIYDKAHLVPFGEYVPLQNIMEPLGIARLVPGDIYFWPGKGAANIKLGSKDSKMGVQICYEIIFSGQVVSPDHRPDFLFNPSNDAWFGDVGPYQHLAQARMRAIEEGLPIIRTTPTGISAIIRSDGFIDQSLALGKAGRLDGYLPRAEPPTLFSQYGNWLPIAFGLLLIGISQLLLAIRRRRG